jgi:signal transduction histidine kinase
LAIGVVGSLAVTLRAWASGSSTSLVTDGPGIVLLAAVLLSCVVAAWALGRSQRLQAEQIAMLAERARRAEADRQERQHAAAAAERARIARELHDVIAHSVTVMVRQAEGGRYVAATDPVAAERALVAIADTGREALTDIRSMLGVLAEDPDRAGDGRAPLAPAPGVGDVPRLVERLGSAGQPVRLRVEGEPRPLPRAADLAAYRLVQEALTNVTKHAGPQVPAEVRLTWTDGALRLDVVDRGADGGAEPLVGLAGGGRGLVGMRERLELAGGGLSVGRSEGGGFSVSGWLPTASSGARGGQLR